MEILTIILAVIATLALTGVGVAILVHQKKRQKAANTNTENNRSASTESAMTEKVIINLVSFLLVCHLLFWLLMPELYWSWVTNVPWFLGIHIAIGVGVLIFRKGKASPAQKLIIAVMLLLMGVAGMAELAKISPPIRMGGQGAGVMNQNYPQSEVVFTVPAKGQGWSRTIPRRSILPGEKYTFSINDSYWYKKVGQPDSSAILVPRGNRPDIPHRFWEVVFQSDSTEETVGIIRPL